VATNIEGAKVEFVRRALYGEDPELLARELGISLQMMKKYERRGAARWMRLALIGMLATNGKPFGFLWPER
jgi:hypothetical protein